MSEPSVTCPRCERTSFNPVDVVEGYCGACHAWTATLTDAELLLAARAMLLHPPSGSSDAEILGALRAVLRWETRP